MVFALRQVKSQAAVRFALRQVLSETVGDDVSASRKTQGKYNCDTLYEVTSIDGYAATFPKGESKVIRLFMFCVLEFLRNAFNA